MTDKLAIVLVLLGIALTSVGAALVYAPAGCFLLGLELAALGIFVDFSPESR